MRKITAADTLDMSVEERMRLVEDIWETISAEVSDDTKNGQEIALLQERLSSHQKNPESGFLLSETLQRLESREHGLPDSC